MSRPRWPVAAAAVCIAMLAGCGRDEEADAAALQSDLLLASAQAAGCAPGKEAESPEECAQMESEDAEALDREWIDILDQVKRNPCMKLEDGRTARQAALDLSDSMRDATHEDIRRLGDEAREDVKALEAC